MITIFILIYLISFAIHLLIEYRENKYVIYRVGDLIDLIEVYMWLPILNTLLILMLIIAVTIRKLGELLKLDILWEKFRNIRLK